MNERVTREQCIVQSVQDRLREVLFGELSYPAASVELLDAFPHEKFDSALDKNYVATGFNFDDGGQAAELGSDLCTRQHTIELFVFAQDPVWGMNLGTQVRDIFNTNDLIALKDLRQEGLPVIDQIIVDKATADHQPVRDPKPWEENVWLVVLKVRDEYSPSAW